MNQNLSPARPTKLKSRMVKQKLEIPKTHSQPFKLKKILKGVMQNNEIMIFEYNKRKKRNVKLRQ